jgi:hypothetical protein
MNLQGMTFAFQQYKNIVPLRLQLGKRYNNVISPVRSRGINPKQGSLPGASMGRTFAKLLCMAYTCERH